MTINEFQYYKKLSSKIIDFLIREKHSSLKDIKIIYNIIMGFAYCLSEDGQYTYHSEFYNSFKELPDDAKEEIAYRAYKLKCSSMFYDNELPQIKNTNNFT